MPVTGQMNLGGEPAPGSAEGIIDRLTVKTCAGITPGPGGVDMRPGGGRIHRQIPSEVSFGIGVGLQGGFDLFPDSGQLPGAEQIIDPPPRPVAVGHVSPGTPDSDAVSDAVDQVALVVASWPAVPGWCRWQRREQIPVGVGEVVAGGGV